jgi:pimeloyl-ACP methyl ester carboxylesterase
MLSFSFLSAQNTIPYGNNPTTGKYALVNGIRLYYEIYGEGQPLLLLHGNGGSIGSRTKEIPGFAKKYKVIAVDSRCHGKSECKTGDLNYEMIAADVNELLNQLKIDSCFIWGHSDGGILGLIIAFQYPDKVKKLVTTGANIQPDSMAIFPELIALAKMYPMIPDTMQQKHIKMMAHHPNISFSRLKDIKAPVLVMAGDRDAIREEHTVKIFQSIPNAQLCILPGTTHFIANEQPILFNMLITDFFDKPFKKPSTVDIIQKMMPQMMQPKKSGQ